MRFWTKNTGRTEDKCYICGKEWNPDEKEIFHSREDGSDKWDRDREILVTFCDECFGKITRDV
jgi:hypothetical protein